MNTTTDCTFIAENGACTCTKCGRIVKAADCSKVHARCRTSPPVPFIPMPATGNTTTGNTTVTQQKRAMIAETLAKLGGGVPRKPCSKCGGQRAN